MQVIRRPEPSVLQLPKRKRVAGYARVSNGKEEMLHSLSAQISYYSDYIQRNRDWEYVGVYADEAFTGTKDELPEFQRMLTDCRNGKIDMIFTKSIARFARNTVTMLETVREMKLIGVDVFFEKENIHSISGDGEVMLTILASYAQEESRSVSENCKWRIRNKFKDGIPNTFETYGYSISKGRIEINPTEADIIQLIFSDYLSGMGRLAIAKKLNAMDIPTKNNRLWDSCKIKEILQNEKYVGDLLLQKKYVSDHLRKKTLKNHGILPQYYVHSNHDAIIERVTYDNAQEELIKRREEYTAGTTTTNVYPFTGMIRCGICGCHFQRKIRNAGEKYERAVWMCSTYGRFGKDRCASKQIPEKILLSLASEILGLTEFDERTFTQKTREIQIPENGILVFALQNGQMIRREWHYKSRSESWSDEARASTRERYLGKSRRKSES